MASGRDSPNLSSVISGLHLIFTLTSVAFLSYKVFNLENELSLIRREVPTQAARESSNAGIDVNATPLTRVQGIKDQEPVSIKHGLRTADHGLRTGYKVRTRYKMRTPG